MALDAKLMRSDANAKGIYKMTKKYHFSIETPRGKYELNAENKIGLGSWNSPEIAEMIRSLVQCDPADDCQTPGSYRLSLNTPYGGYQIEGVSAAHLILLSSSETTGIIESLIGSKSKLAFGMAVRESLRPCNAGNGKDFNLDVAAREALETYYASKPKPTRRYHGTTISRAGLELDLVKCYLRNMTVKQTIEWLKKNKDFDTNKSVVSRYTTALWKFGVHPVENITNMQED